MNPAPASPAPASIAIIGGGIIGISIAWRLAQKGFRVTVLEQNTIGGEASWAGAGMLAPGGEIDGPSPLASLAIESRRLYGSFVRELEDASGFAIDYQECGGLDLAYAPEEWEELQARAGRQSALGIESKPLTPKQVTTFWPRIRPEKLVGARFYSGDAIVNPREVVLALAAACRKHGVEVRQNCAARTIAIHNDAVEIQTSRNHFTFSAAVLAAGAWSSSISLTGVPAQPLAEPIKGHIIGYHQPDQTCNTILRHGHTYLLQRASGLLIAGASVEHAGFDRQIDPRRVATLAAEAASLLPHLSETEPTETWIGFRPGSDSLHIGPWNSDRLYLAYGHFRNGILLAPVTANRIASALTISGHSYSARVESPECLWRDRPR